MSSPLQKGDLFLHKSGCPRGDHEDTVTGWIRPEQHEHVLLPTLQKTCPPPPDTTSAALPCLTTALSSTSTAPRKAA